MKKELLVFGLVAVTLSACGDHPKSVEYYLQHQDEMRKVQADCKNKGVSPLADTNEARNCRAAAEAATRHYFKR